MQAGTEFAMESCSRLGFAQGWGPSLYETPLTRVSVSLAEVMPLLGERLEGGVSSFLALVPFSCGYKQREQRLINWYVNTTMATAGASIATRMLFQMQTDLCGCGLSVCFCLYLGLWASVVFLLGQVLSALGLRTRYVVCNSHWKHRNASARMRVGGTLCIHCR